MISVRPDEFGEELAAEMERLRDRCRAVAFAELAPIVEESLGEPLDELFASIDPMPLATASIAQVHPAVLREACRAVWGEDLPAGTEVVVKVIRPGAAEALRSDVVEAGACRGAGGCAV